TCAPPSIRLGPRDHPTGRLAHATDVGHHRSPAPQGRCQRDSSAIAREPGAVGPCCPSRYASHRHANRTRASRQRKHAPRARDRMRRPAARAAKTAASPRVGAGTKPAGRRAGGDDMVPSMMVVPEVIPAGMLTAALETGLVAIALLVL